MSVCAEFPRCRRQHAIESRQVRLQRLYPKSLVKDAVHTILVPKPMTARVGGTPLRDTAVLQWASDLIGAVMLGGVCGAFAAPFG